LTLGTEYLREAAGTASSAPLDDLLAVTDERERSIIGDNANVDLDADELLRSGPPTAEGGDEYAYVLRE
jgi:hypothetical protein